MCSPLPSAFRGVLVWWADVSGTNTSECDGRLTRVGWTAGRRAPRVKAIGRQDSSPTGQMVHSTTKTTTEKEKTS
jgi:hypothetical protein